MLGLLLNNFYLVIKNLKLSFSFYIILLLVYIFYPNQLVIYGYIFITLVILPCSYLNVTTISKNSKWNQFEENMPLEREKIILSRYLSYFSLSALTIVLLLVVIVLQNVFTGDNVLDIIINIRGMRTVKVSEIIKTYIFQSQLISILYFPLLSLFKTDKTDIVILASVGISLVIVFLVSSWNLPGLIVLNVCLYILSYAITCLLEKQENNNL